MKNEYLLKMIKEANANITHEQFVEGAKNNTMGFKVIFGEPNQLLRGYRKTIFSILVMFYLIVPIIIIPIISFFHSNWWLMFGIAFSLLFAQFAAWVGAKNPGRWKAAIIYIYGIVCIIYWIIKGFHFIDYITFFFFCALWSFFFFRMAENAQRIYAMETLVENPDIFYKAIEKDFIMITKVDKESLQKENIK
jgi:hypothetical protein